MPTPRPARRRRRSSRSRAAAQARVRAASGSVPRSSSMRWPSRSSRLRSAPSRLVSATITSVDPTVAMRSRDEVAPVAGGRPRHELGGGAAGADVVGRTRPAADADAHRVRRRRGAQQVRHRPGPAPRRPLAQRDDVRRWARAHDLRQRQQLVSVSGSTSSSTTQPRTRRPASGTRTIVPTRDRVGHRLGHEVVEGPIDRGDVGPHPAHPLLPHRFSARSSPPQGPQRAENERSWVRPGIRRPCGARRRGRSAPR